MPLAKNSLDKFWSLNFFSLWADQKLEGRSLACAFFKTLLHTCPLIAMWFIVSFFPLWMDGQWEQKFVWHCWYSTLPSGQSHQVMVILYINNQCKRGKSLWSSQPHLYFFWCKQLPTLFEHKFWVGTFRGGVQLPWSFPGCSCTFPPQSFSPWTQIIQRGNVHCCASVQVQIKRFPKSVSENFLKR